MSDLLTAPAKRLGWLAQPDFCARCFYVKHRLRWQVPWSLPMPIYISLDKAQKAHISEFIDKNGKAPEWMNDLGSVDYIDPPHYSKFFFINTEHQVKVRGNADLMVRLANGKLKIVDLKTAKARGDEDHLAPTYLVQQTAYAMAAEYQGLGEVEGAALLYMTALTDSEVPKNPAADQAGDMIVPFRATVHPLTLDVTQVNDLCGRYRSLCEMETMPAAREGCKECQRTELIYQAYVGEAPVPTVASEIQEQHGPQLAIPVCADGASEITVDTKGRRCPP